MTTAHLLFHRRAMQHGPAPSCMAWHARWLVRWLLGVLCLAALLSGGVQAQTIQTVAGSGLGPEGAPATSAALNSPMATALDNLGNLYIADTNNHRIRKVDATSGTITTVAGNGTPGFSGDGATAINAQLHNPRGVALDSAGHLYIADYGNHRIRKVDATSGTITTVAGNGTSGFVGDGATAISAQLSYPRGVALDSAGNLYIADTSNHRIRKVDASGTITTVAGNGTPGFSGDGATAISAQLSYPLGVALDSLGHLYIADTSNHRIRKVDASGTITTVAGNGTPGFAGDGATATNAQLRTPTGVALDSAGNLYIADSNNHRIRKVNASGTITTVAGNGTSGFAGDGATATSAQLSYPMGVTLDSAGNLYIADSNNHRIRKVNASGTITTVAGNGTPGFGGDGATATSARLSSPVGVALDSAGHLYIADYNNHRIRKVDATSGTITTVAGNGTSGFAGDGATATSALLNAPLGVALDSTGHLYIADYNNHRIRKVVPAAPGVPTATTATAGEGAVAVAWAAPSSDGGSAITGYTVTGSPGGSCTATPPATACTVTGLANGTAHTFTVVAHNAAGNSAPSAPAAATPMAPVPQPLMLPGGAGNGSVLISGGPPGCTVAPGMAFSSAVPPNTPAGATAPLGVLRFTATGCAGATLSVSITYPAGSLAGLTPHKYTPATGWFAHGTVSGNTVTYQVTDNGQGDSNTTTPGVIEDPFAPLQLAAAPAPGGAVAIPTLGEWGLVLLSLLAAALGMGALRRRGVQGV